MSAAGIAQTAGDQAAMAGASGGGSADPSPSHQPAGGAETAAPPGALTGPAPSAGAAAAGGWKAAQVSDGTELRPPKNFSHSSPINGDSGAFPDWADRMAAKSSGRPLGRNRATSGAGCGAGDPGAAGGRVRRKHGVCVCARMEVALGKWERRAHQVTCADSVGIFGTCCAKRTLFVAREHGQR